jgi:hypothetical protein
MLKELQGLGILSQLKIFSAKVSVEEGQKHINSWLFMFLELFLGFELLNKFLHTQKVRNVLQWGVVQLELNFGKAQFSFQIEQRVWDVAVFKHLDCIQIIGLSFLEHVLTFLFHNTSIEKGLCCLTALSVQLFSDSQSFSQIF